MENARQQFTITNFEKTVRTITGKNELVYMIYLKDSDYILFMKCKLSDEPIYDRRLGSTNRISANVLYVNDSRHNIVVNDIRYLKNMI